MSPKKRLPPHSRFNSPLSRSAMAAFSSCVLARSYAGRACPGAARAASPTPENAFVMAPFFVQAKYFLSLPTDFPPLKHLYSALFWHFVPKKRRQWFFLLHCLRPLISCCGSACRSSAMRSPAGDRTHSAARITKSHSNRFALDRLIL